MASYRLLFSAALLPTFILACVDPDIAGPKSIESSSQVLAPSRREPVLRTMDDDFESLTATAKGFGGLFYGRDGRLNVYLKDPASRHAAAPALVDFLSRGHAASRATRESEVAAMNVLPAKFDYRELGSWYRRLSSLFGAPVLPSLTSTKPTIEFFSELMGKRVVASC